MAGTPFLSIWDAKLNGFPADVTDNEATFAFKPLIPYLACHPFPPVWKICH